MIGTDYGHADSASELRALDGVLKNSKFSSSVAEKIVGGNAKALYSLRWFQMNRDPFSAVC